MKQQFLNDSGLTELIGYIKKYVKDDQDVKPYASLSVFPKTGEQNIIYIDTTTNSSYYWDNNTKTYKALDVQTWANLTGKPTTFPPSSHTHDDRYYTETEINTKLAAKADSSHKHVKADITDFPTSMPASDVPAWAKASSKPSYSWSEINNKPSTFTPSSHTHGSGDITSLSADKITGVISIDHLPAGALERCKIVADDTARFKLTKNDIQNGDTVKVGTDANARMYFVIDDTKLSSEAGYTIYTAGSATSVPWSGVTGKPSTFTPSSHKHTISDITNISSASVSYATSAGSSASCTGNAATATLLKLSYTSPTLTTDTSTWRGDIKDGTVVWGQKWKDTRFSNDTGDLTLWLNKVGDLATINMVLDGTVTACQGFNGDLIKMAPQLCASSEHNEITIKINDNGIFQNSTGISNASLRNGLDFKWYDTNWQIGNIRGGSVDSIGFGFAFKSSSSEKISLKSYIDTDGVYHGNLSGNASTATNVAWSGITGKPSTYTPSSHDHSYVLDVNGSSHTTFAYSKAGLGYGDYTWLAGWNGCELRAINKSQFAQASHTHTKSQITDFPSSLPASDVYAWAKASNKPSYTKAEVGLGNVDNTADSTKSVKYATSAGSAGNSAKWNGYELDLATDNTKDTWLLVANNGKIQHRLSTSFASASHTHSYLPLSGGTLTGFVSQTGSGSKDVGYEARNTDTGASIKFIVGSGKWNKGLYDTNAGNWMVYADQNNKVYLNGTAATASAVSWKNVTDKRRCYVGQSGSTKTKPWYKFASFKTTVAYEDRRISFKVSGGFGSNDSRCGVLTAHLRTNEHKNEESVWLRWEYATNLIDPSKFVLIYKNTTNTSTDVELWVKIDEPYVFYHFTVLTEEYRDIFADYSWTLYNQSSAGYADAPTSGYTQVYSKVCHLADKMSMSSLYGYYGMITPSGSDGEYIRTTSSGLLPYQSGGAGNGHSTLGTPSWYFSSAYIDNVNAAASVKIGQPNNSNNGAIELYGNTPYIDFHTSGTNTDYSSRIIAYSDRIEFVFA